jgi:transglutaminase/protease-like cytokinesis protein 3
MQSLVIAHDLAGIFYFLSRYIAEVRYFSPKKSSMKTLLFICFTALPQLFMAQSQNKVKVDSLVRTINTTGIRDVDELADTLTSKLTDDSLKIRALFFWITEHIAYDCEGFQKGNPVQYKGDRDQYEYARVKRTLTLKKGVCADYAYVLKLMCYTLKIECEVVEGFSLNSAPMKYMALLHDETADHAWNAVKVHGKWYLLDLTWASGSTDATVSKFHRQRNERYYLTDPQVFILDHHPANPRWQLLEKPLNMKEFIYNSMNTP